jgi:hypothetical protein
MLFELVGVGESKKQLFLRKKGNFLFPQNFIALCAHGNF